MKPKLYLPLRLYLPGIFLLLNSYAFSTTYTWNWGTGTWSTAALWSPNGVPGPGDDVILPGGTCTLDADVSVTNFTITDGTLSGNFDLTVNGNLTCSGGTIEGIGNLTISGSTLLTNTYTRIFSRIIYLNGGGSTSTNGRFYTHANCEIHLPAGQTFTMNTTGYTAWNGWPNNCTFYLDGTLIKNGPDPAHFLYQTFVTTGEIIINQGSIDWANGGIHNGTNITINGSNSYLGLGGGTHTFTNCHFSGTGSVPIYGNANVTSFTGNTWSNTLHLRMHDGTMTLGQDLTLPTYRHLGGTLNGSGNLTVLDSVLLSNGTIENAGTWNIGTTLTCAGGNLSGSGTMNVTGVTRLSNTTYLFYRTINMNGGGYTEANGRFYTHGGCQINLPAGRTFTLLATEYTPWHGWTNGGTITIDGTLIKNGAGQAHFVSPSVNLNGTIQINQGSIDLNNTSTHIGMEMSIYSGAYTTALNGTQTYSNCHFKGSGSYYAAPTTTLLMSGITYSPGISGTGILKLEKAAFAFPVTVLNADINSNTGPGSGNDKLEIIGSANLNGGTVHITDAGVPDGNYTILSYTENRIGTFSTLNAPAGCSLIYDDALKLVILNKATPPDNDGDGYNANIDCNDSDPGIHPGAVEICNNVDDDCDGLVDDSDSGILGQATWYADTDSDGYGDILSSMLACTQPSGYVSNGDDCDDEDSGIYPGASEVCNGLDDDCNGVIDDGVQNTYYQDADGDSFGNPLVTILACSAPNGYVIYAEDCDDTNADIYPGATEQCNGMDDDCNGYIDENVLLTFYADADNDGYGDLSNTLLACTPPPGYVFNATDCDDANPEIHPGAVEICNQSDDDCDGIVDDGVQTTFFADADADGYGDAGNIILACVAPSGFVINDLDCNDQNASIYPGAPESCNLTDDNCNGLIDEGVELSFYRDMDGDGFGDPDDEILACTAPSGYVSNAGDCDDTNDLIHPGATESCNGMDDNCNGLADEDVMSLFYADNDHDGYGLWSSSIWACVAPQGYVTNPEDCDDQNPTIHPGAVEICNEEDDDCDGMIDEEVLNTYFEDADGDGYGNAGSTIQDCGRVEGYVENALDCNDNNPQIHPGALETCNQLDDNCDGQVDEGVQLQFYADTDGDGFGNMEAYVWACTAPPGYTTDATDCNDTNASVYPGASEWCNGLDDNCNGETDESFDLDGDGFSLCDGDCNDLNSSIYPGAPETCNNIDDNCNGIIDEGATDSDNDGICDTDDNCPYTYNPDQADNENDGIGDVCDPNDDNDPKPDHNDCAPFDPTIYPGAPEICGDLIDNDCDNKIDDPLKIDVLIEQDVLCHGDASGMISITGECGLPPYTYLWNNGNSTSTITNLSGGTYKVTVTDAQGLTKKKTFKINEPSAINLSVSSTDVSCHGDNDGTAKANVHGGNSPYTYLWSNGETTRKITGLYQGTYTVTVTDENGCTKTGVAYVEEPTLLQITNTIVSPDPTHPGKFSITVTATGGTPYNNGYRYRRCSQSGSDCTSWQVSNVLTNLSPGTYLVKVKDANGCIAMETVSINSAGCMMEPSEIITMEIDNLPVEPIHLLSIRTEDDPAHFEFTSLRPNPGKEYAIIFWNSVQNEEVDIQVTDLTGRPILKRNIEATIGQNESLLDMSDLAPGIYFVSIQNEDNIQSKVWIKTD